jgi:hypothetical protein
MKYSIPFTAAFILTATFVLITPRAAHAYLMPQYGDFLDTSKKTEVDCEKIKGPRTMVALVFGQSNSANHGETPYTPKHNVYNFFEGKCYVAADPLLGATGNGGSVWSRLGDMLIEEGLYDNVIFVSVGVGGTPIKRWTTNGDLQRRIFEAYGPLKKKGFRITHMFWHQGEADRNDRTKKADYIKMFMAMLGDIRKHGIDAPIYVAVATMCGSTPESFEIQEAQRELVNTSLKIYPGAFSDEIKSIEDRHDACHFSSAGMLKHAAMWLNAVKYSGQ